MPDRVSPHRHGAAQMVKDGKKALHAYVARCKTMTPEQFAMEPRRLTSRLSAAQYAEIVRAILPDAPLPKAAKPVTLRKSDQARNVAPQVQAKGVTSKLWKAVPKSWRPSVVAALCGLASVAVGAGAHEYGRPSPKPTPLIRSRVVSNWPACAGLAPTTDGCVFYNAAPLDWTLVSKLLVQDLAMLRANNPHLSPSFIPSHSAIVVWRGLGQLVEDNP